MPERVLGMSVEVLSVEKTDSSLDGRFVAIFTGTNNPSGAE